MEVRFIRCAGAGPLGCLALLVMWGTAWAQAVAPPAQTFALLRFDGAEGDKVRLSVIVVDSRQAAERVAERLQYGQSFDDLARRFSVDFVSSVFGGQVGLVPTASLRPEYQEALKGLGPGEVSGILTLVSSPPPPAPRSFALLRCDGFGEGKVRLSIILVDTLQLAETVLQGLKQGQPFEELAKRYSTDPATKGAGGQAGLVAEANLRTEFQEALRGLHEGETTGIVAVMSAQAVPPPPPQRITRPMPRRIPKPAAQPAQADKSLLQGNPDHWYCWAVNDDPDLIRWSRMGDPDTSPLGERNAERIAKLETGLADLELDTPLHICVRRGDYGAATYGNISSARAPNVTVHFKQVDIAVLGTGILLAQRSWKAQRPEYTSWPGGSAPAEVDPEADATDLLVDLWKHKAAAQWIRSHQAPKSGTRK